MPRVLQLVSAAVLLAPGMAWGQTVLRVSPDGPTPAWPVVYPDLQAAIDAAAQATGSVEIWVRAGQYVPSARTFPSQPKSATFKLRSQVSILGGFAGTETAAAQRQPSVNVTILSGENSVWHVVTGVGVDQSAVIDGVTIQRGQPEKVAGIADSRYGGGLYLTNGASPMVRGCVLTKNSSIGGYEVEGFAAYLYSGSPVFENCRFVGNGNDFNRHGVLRAVAGSLTLRDCDFVDNTAHPVFGYAAGLEAAGAAVTLERCTFKHCVGGTGAIRSLGVLTATDCVFTDCGHGEGVGAVLADDTGRFIRCRFEGNLSSGPGPGAVEGNGEFIDCSFTGNRGGAGAFQGTGKMAGCRLVGNSGVSVVSGRWLLLDDCDFTGNTGHSSGGVLGGVVVLSGVWSSVTNCTIVSNTGIGIRLLGTGGVEVANTILWNNHVLQNSNESTQLRNDAGVAAVSYCYIQGLTGALGGTRNIDAPTPGFVDPLGPDGTPGTGDEDLRLAAGSVCIDAGNSTLGANDEFDLDGLARQHDDPITPDSGEGPSPLVDLGAHEFQGISCILADRDGNGRIEPADISAFVRGWLAGGSLDFDFDRNGAIGPADVSAFVISWFQALVHGC